MPVTARRAGRGARVRRARTVENGGRPTHTRIYGQRRLREAQTAAVVRQRRTSITVARSVCLLRVSCGALKVYKYVYGQHGCRDGGKGLLWRPMPR